MILATFEVSAAEAQEHAIGLVALAEGWGGDTGAGSLEWPVIIKKQLGASLRWRSDMERQQFAAERDLVVRSYQRQMQHSKRA